MDKRYWRGRFGAPLSPGQQEIMRWVCMGKTDPEIGQILGKSVKLVNKQVHFALQKLGVPNRTAAAVALVTRSKDTSGT
jgi:DNA-binding NarL/FixJ family response regulator